MSDDDFMAFVFRSNYHNCRCYLEPAPVACDSSTISAMSARIMAHEDADVISVRIREVEADRYHWCYSAAGLNTSGCWCRKAGENGADLPCTSANRAPSPRAPDESG